MSEIKNDRLILYGAKHLKCNHTMTLGFKGLTMPSTSYNPQLQLIILRAE